MSAAVHALTPPVGPLFPPDLLKLPQTTLPKTLPPLPVLIVGLDDRGRPHASRFSDSEAAAAREAAALMGMSVVTVDSEPLRALADKLPRGRIFSSGKAFVPFVSRGLYERLAVHVPAGGKPHAEPTKGTGPSASGPAPATPIASPTARGGLPEEWRKIRKGSVVLACDKPDDGWWEAVVTEDKGDDMLVLKWRDWSDMPPFLRKRDQLALLPPNLAQPGGV